MTNVLLLTVDSLRADYTFGRHAPASLETVPRLADDGLRFANAFSNAAYTKGSFLSILSGTYPWAFDPGGDGFEPDRPHLAEILSEAGYATAGFHTNAYLSPTYGYDRGFDHYLGRDATEDSADGVETTYTRLVERAVSTRGVADVIHGVYRAAGKHLGVQLGSSLYRPAEELHDAAVEWAQGQTEPAFIWIHYMDVHNPYYPHEGTVSEGISHRRAVRLFHRVNERRADAPESDIDALETLYRGEIEYLDRELGDLFERLARVIDLEDTVVAFASDHGEAFGENGHVFHPGYALYDENVHVPLVVSGPGIDSGVVETPVSNVDLVPTLLSAVDVEIPRPVAGEDVTAFLDRPPGERRVFAEAWTPDDGHVMATDGRHMLIRHVESDEEELYDRRERPTRQLEPEGADAPVRDELAEAIDEHVRDVTRAGGRSADVEVTEDVRLQLRKLGYDE